LHKHFTPEEWEEMCSDDDDALEPSDSYWTEWETADYEELDDAEAALEKAEQALTAARLELGRARLSEGG
jgi:multidrug efflux pump subunit AcrA (membrane-fusion protein)